MSRKAVKGAPEDAPKVFFVSGSLIDESIRKDFGRHISAMLQNSPMSQADLARRVFGPGTGGFAKGRDLISKYMRGITFPNTKTLVKIADAFDVDVSVVLPPSYKALQEKGTKADKLTPLGNGFMMIEIKGIVPDDVGLDIMSRYLAGDRTYKAFIESQTTKRGKS